MKIFMLEVLVPVETDSRKFVGFTQSRLNKNLGTDTARVTGNVMGGDASAEAIEGTRGRVTQGLFWRAFGEMLGAGVPLGTALDCAAEIYEGEERERVCRVAEGLEPGTALTPAMEATGLFSGASLQLCSIGEQTGTLDMTAQKAADYLEAETRTAGWLTEDAATQASRPGTGRATPDRRR